MNDNRSNSLTIFNTGGVNDLYPYWGGSEEHNLGSIPRVLLSEVPSDPDSQDSPGFPGDFQNFPRFCGDFRDFPGISYSPIYGPY